MNSVLKSLLAGAALAMMSSAASAAVINLNTWVTGANTGTTSVGTIQLTQNGSNVDFVVTNTVGNLGALAQSNTAIDYIRLSYSGANALTQAGDVTNTSGQSFTLSAGNATDASYSFNLQFDYPNAAASRFTNGETSSFTILNVLVADFLNPSNANDADKPDGIIGLAHVISLTSGGGSAKVGGSLPQQPPTDVPEPAGLSLLGAGLVGAAMLRRRRKA